MAKKPTEIEGIDPLTTGKRAHGEDVKSNSIFNKKAAVKAPVEDPKIAGTEPTTETDEL